MKKYFLKGDHQWREYVKVKNRLRDPVEFKRFNLMEPFPFQEPFDCIFCRNVMIYFDKKTQKPGESFLPVSGTGGDPLYRSLREPDRYSPPLQICETGHL